MYKKTFLLSIISFLGISVLFSQTTKLGSTVNNQNYTKTPPVESTLIYSPYESRVAEDCPGTSLFSNPLDGQNSAGPSEEALDIKAAQSFFVDGTIDTIVVWGINGLYSPPNFDECDNESPMLFNVYFYTQNEDTPGELYKSFYTLEATSVNTEHVFLSKFNILRHTIILPESVTGINNGFISVVGASDNSCSFYWVNAPNGQGIYSQYQNGSWSVLDNQHLSICLSGTPNNCLAPTNLTATNLSTNQAELSWAENNISTEWSLKFLNTFSQVSSTTTISDNPYTKTGLSPNQIYKYSTRSVCGVGDTSIFSAPHIFKTPCNTITTFPLSENFDNNWELWCWNIIDADNDGFTWSQDNQYISPTHSGDFAAHGMGNQDDWLISPQLELDENYQISWWDKVEDENKQNSYEILVSTTGNDLENFTTKIKDVSCTNTNWMQHFAYLSAFTGQNIYIAIHQTFSASDVYGFGIDDFEIDLLSDCVPVSNITVSNITTNSASVSWTENGNSTSWNLKYGLEGFTDEGTNVNVTETNYELTNLQENTDYDIYVQAKNGTETSVWIGPINFTTPCFAVSVIDYFQGFEDLDNFDCWKARYNTANDGGLNGNNLRKSPNGHTWFIATPESFQGNGANYIYEGERSAVILYDAPDFNWLISPNINLSDVEGLHIGARLNFALWIKNEPSLNWITKFNVLIFNGTEWIVEQSWDETTPINNFYEELVQIDLTNYIGETIKVAFVYEFNDGCELAVDNIGFDVFDNTDEEPEFATFSFLEQTEEAVINKTEKNIKINVAEGTNLTSLVASYTLTHPGTVFVNEVTQQSGVTANNFSDTVKYLIISQNGHSGYSWDVIVSVKNSINSSLKDKLKLYPNPTSSVVWIDGLNGNNNTISVIDVSGKVVTTYKNNPKPQINLENYENGFYFITIEAENEKATFRIIKK